MNMRPLLVALMALAITAPAVAQEPASPVPSADAAAQDRSGYPVSLDRIREGLRRAQNQRLLRNLQLQPTFKVSIEEQDRINRLMSKIEVPKPGPQPGGGWYGYEQQRRLFNPTDRPLQQPYAAFSGGQLTVTGTLEAMSEANLRTQIENLGLAIKAIRYSSDLEEKQKTLVYELKLKMPDVFQVSSNLVNQLVSLPGVLGVRWV